MRRPFGIAIVAASVFAVALAMPSGAHARKAVAAAAAAPAATERSDISAQKAKRIRKPPVRRVAAVAPPPPYYPQCFLFFCSSGVRPFHFLVLGTAY